MPSLPSWLGPFLRRELGRSSMKLRCLMVAVCALLVLAPTALGARGGSAGRGARGVGGGGGTGYGGDGGGVQNQVDQGAVHAVAGKSPLPFTGLDLALLVVGGLSLVVVGAGLRRASRRPS